MAYAETRSTTAVSSRTAYAMGRVKAFPNILAELNLKHRSPVNAIILGAVISLAVMLALGFGYTPVTAFAMVGTALVILIVAVYILMNAACIGFFVRSSQHTTNLVSHILIPVLGIAAFVPAWLAGAGIKVPGLSFISPLPPPLSYMGPAVAVWMVLGLVYLAYLYRRDPRRVVDVGLIHIGAEPEVSPDPRVA